MTYTNTLNNTDYFNEGFFVRLSPRRKVLHTSFSLLSGSVYSASFDYGPVRSVAIDGVDLTEGTSTTLSAGQWFWESNVLYIRKSDSGAPGSGDFIVVTYDLFISDQDFAWYRTPTDDTTSLVDWVARLKKFPQIKQTTSDLLSGFIPTSVDSLEIINADHAFEKHLSSSFYKAEVKGWHWVGDLSTSQLSLIFDGLVEGIDYSQTDITFKLTDIYEAFNEGFRVSAGASDFYNTTDFPNLDTNYIGKPKRRVYGYVEAVKCVNLDYSTNNTETDNQNWGVFNSDAAISDAGGFGYILMNDNVSSTSGNDINFIDADYTQHFQVGDQVYFVNGFSYVGERYVTSIGTGKITMNASMAGWTNVAGDYLYRGQVPRIRIEQNDVIYTARWSKHFDILTSNGVAYANFKSGYSTNLGMSPIKYSDTVFADVYGIQCTSVVNSANEPKDTFYNITVNPIDILYDIMTTNMGIDTADFSTAWETLADSIAEPVGFAVPKTVSEDYPTFKDVLAGILATARLRIFKDNNNKWSIKRIAQIGTTVDTATDEDIVTGTFGVSLEYSEILSDVFVEYNYRERGLLAGQQDEEHDTASSTSETAKFLHKIKRQKTFQSYHIESANAQTLCDAIRHYYADRLARYKMRLSKRFLDSLIGDEVTLTREKIPGLTYTEGTNQSKDLVIIEINKSPDSVNVIFDDQQGLEDNA